MSYRRAAMAEKGVGGVAAIQYRGDLNEAYEYADC